MYDLFKSIISHDWNTSSGYNSTEQSLIYTACIVFIIVISAVILEWVFRVFKSLLSRR